MFFAPLRLRVRNALVSANFHSWGGIDHVMGERIDHAMIVYSSKIRHPSYYLKSS
jgi:hypothetical protein